MIPQPKLELPSYTAKGTTPPSTAVKGQRPAYWEEYQDFRSTPVYQLESLECGNVVEGPAIMESEYTTVVLPPGSRLTVNKYLCGEIEPI